MAAGPFAALGEPCCGQFFTVLQCEMEEKWPSAVQNKMSQKWAQNEGSF